MEWDDPTIYFEEPCPDQDTVASEWNGDIFHRNNPRIAIELRRMALRLSDAGHQHYSIKGLFEVLRWHTALETTDQKYKLNNNLTAYYARLLMQCEPRLRGFFRVRSSKGRERHGERF